MGVVSTTGGHGFQLITFLLEQGPEGLVMLWVIIAAIATKCLDQVSVPGLHAPKGELNILGFESENEQFEMNWAFFTYVFIAVPIVSIGIPVVKLVVGSFYCTDGHAKADWSEWLEITDASLASAWAGKKIPYCVMYENYMREKIHFKQDFLETMLHREELFAASFTTHDLMHYINTFTTQNLGHSPLRDKDEVATVYNRGNDFYGFFLGEPMKYSCASTGPWTTRSKKPSTGCLTSSAVKARWKKARTTLTLAAVGAPSSPTLPNTLVSTRTESPSPKSKQSSVSSEPRTTASPTTCGLWSRTTVPSSRTTRRFQRSTTLSPASKWPSMSASRTSSPFCSRCGLCSSQTASSTSRLPASVVHGSTKTWCGVSL